MILLVWMIAGAVVFYLILTLYLSLLVQQIPRRPVSDPPDWGSIEDTFVPAIDGGRLEVWRIEPERESRGTVLLAHGWGRNRDRMVNRARMFGSMGYTTVVHSARDHGNSSPRFVMNALRFAEDIEAVINWIGEPVVLYGHSAGSGGAILTAARRPEKVRLLFLEASYAYTRPALLSLYRWFNRVVGTLLGPMILFWMNLYYRGMPDRPARSQVPDWTPTCRPTSPARDVLHILLELARRCRRVRRRAGIRRSARMRSVAAQADSGHREPTLLPLSGMVGRHGRRRGKAAMRAKQAVPSAPCVLRAARAQ